MRYNDYMYISLIGPPCSGKGTHSRILQQQKQFQIIGAGDTLREYAVHDQYVADLVNNGQIVPIDIIWKLMSEKIIKTVSAGQERILLDGFPREQIQAEYLHKFLKEQDQPIYFIELAVADEILIERMQNRGVCDKCGMIANCKIGMCTVCESGNICVRADDNIEVFEQRLKVYHSNKNALYEYLTSHGYHWHKVDASGDLSGIAQQIFDIAQIQ